MSSRKSDVINFEILIDETFYTLGFLTINHR